MKRYFLWAIILSGVALFGLRSASAEELFLDTSSDPTLVCYSGESDSNDDSCDATPSYSGTQNLSQGLLISPNTSFDVSKIQLLPHSLGQGVSSSNNYLLRMYLLNSSQWSTYLNTGTSTVSAISATPESQNVTPGSYLSFNFPSPYSVNSPDDLRGFVVEMSFTNAPDQPEFRWSLSPGSEHPLNFSGDAELYNMFYDSPGNASNDNLDLVFRLYTVNAPLAITYPENNSTVNDLPLTILGTCLYDVDVFVYDGLTYASSTTAFSSGRLCNSNTFSYPVNLQQGFWNVSASSTDASVGITFYYSAQSTTAEDYANQIIENLQASLSCYIPFLNWDPCLAVSNVLVAIRNAITGSLQSFGTLIAQTKPISYYFQISSVLSENLSSTNTTSTLNLSVPVFGTNTELFNSSTTPNQILGEAPWDNVRNFMKIGLYIGFLVYIIYLIL